MSAIVALMEEHRTYSLEWVGHWDFANGGPLVGGMESLNSEDRSSNGEVLRAGDQRCSTEVSAGTDVLEHRGERDEAWPVIVR